MAPVYPKQSNFDFVDWMVRVRRLLRSRTGADLETFAPLPLRDAFELGESPDEFVDHTVRDASTMW